MLKLKLQYFGHLMWQADSLEKTLILGKTEGKRGRGWQRMTWLDDITDSMDMNLGKLWEMVGDRETSVHGIAKSQTQLSDWRRMTMKSRNNFHWEQWCAAWLNVKYYKEFCKNKQTDRQTNLEIPLSWQLTSIFWIKLLLICLLTDFIQNIFMAIIWRDKLAPEIRIWQCMCAESLHSFLTLSDPMDVAYQASLSMGFSRQEHWSGLPCPPSGALPDPWIKLAPALQADSLRWASGKAQDLKGGLSKLWNLCPAVAPTHAFWFPSPPFVAPASLVAQQ